MAVFSSNAPHAHKVVQYGSNIVVKAKGILPEFSRYKGLTAIDTSIDRLGILECHFPEGVFDNTGGVVANAQFQIQDTAFLMLQQKGGGAQ